MCLWGSFKVSSHQECWPFTFSESKSSFSRPATFHSWQTCFSSKFPCAKCPCWLPSELNPETCWLSSTTKVESLLKFFSQPFAPWSLLPHFASSPCPMRPPVRASLALPKPSSLQTTLADCRLQRSSHTVPHSLSFSTSTRPSPSLAPPFRRTLR